MDDEFTERLVYSDSDEDQDPINTSFLAKDNHEAPIDDESKSSTVDNDLSQGNIEFNENSQNETVAPDETTIDNRSNADDSDDDDGDLVLSRRSTKAKKNVLVSDDEEASDADKSTNLIDEIDQEIMNATSARPAIWDSDTASSSHGSADDAANARPKKKSKEKMREELKKRSKKKKEKAASDADDGSDKSGCDSDEEVSKPKRKSNSGTESDTSKSEDSDNTTGSAPSTQIREKPQKRVYNFYYFIGASRFF